MFLLLLSRSWRWRPGFDPSAPVCVCSSRLQTQTGGAKERKAPSALMHSSFLSRRETSAAERLPQISKRTDRILVQ